MQVCQESRSQVVVQSYFRAPTSMDEVQSRVKAEEELLQKSCFTHPLTKEALESLNNSRRYGETGAMFRWMEGRASSFEYRQTPSEVDLYSQHRLECELREMDAAGRRLTVFWWRDIERQMKEQHGDHRKLLRVYRDYDDYIRLWVKEHRHGPRRDRLRRMYLRNVAHHHAMNWSTRTYPTLIGKRPERDVMVYGDDLISLPCSSKVPPGSWKGQACERDRHLATPARPQSDLETSFTSAIWALSNLRKQFEDKPSMVDDYMEYARTHHHNLTNDSYTLGGIMVSLLETSKLPHMQLRQIQSADSDVSTNPNVWTHPTACEEVVLETKDLCTAMPRLRGGGGQKLFGKLKSRPRERLAENGRRISGMSSDHTQIQQLELQRRLTRFQRVWQRIRPCRSVVALGVTSKAPGPPSASRGDTSVVPDTTRHRSRLSSLAPFRDHASRKKKEAPSEVTKKSLVKKTSSFKEELGVDGPAAFARDQELSALVLTERLNILAAERSVAEASSGAGCSSTRRASDSPNVSPIAEADNVSDDEIRNHERAVTLNYLEEQSSENARLISDSPATVVKEKQKREIRVEEKTESKVEEKKEVKVQAKKKGRCTIL